MAPGYVFQVSLRVTVQNQIRIAQRIIVDEVIQFRPLCHSHVQRILFLLEQFLISPNEHTEDYNRWIIDTFVNRIEITDTEMLIYFNLSEASASEKQKNSQPNSCSTGNHLVHLAHQQANYSLYAASGYFSLVEHQFSARLWRTA